VGTVHGIGGLAGGPLSAACVVWGGYNAAFLALAAIAALAGAAFRLTLPETRRSGLRSEAGQPGASPAP
jgi:predicted MFS family arabinose efflux permease